MPTSIYPVLRQLQVVASSTGARAGGGKASRWSWEQPWQSWHWQSSLGNPCYSVARRCLCPQSLRGLATLLQSIYSSTFPFLLSMLASRRRRGKKGKLCTMNNGASGIRGGVPVCLALGWNWTSRLQNQEVLNLVHKL